MKNYTFMLLVLLTFVCCSDRHDHLTEPGVSKALAEYRSEKYSDITYNLSFSIPVEKDKPVSGSLKLELTLKDRSDIVLDFTGGENSLLEVILNGNIVKKTIKNGHLFIPLTETLVGNNTIEVEFTAGDMSLNRRDEFLYTLLVPDRARTVFPCFDQPDMKATYNLELTLPAHWTAIANGKESSTSIDGDNKTVRFEPTEPLSTYLFSFVCGQFEKVRGEKDGRVIELYHRETDPAKTSQCGDILEEVFASLEWLEEYTTIPYPFKKYDLIIIPGFQYGGMEHTGATLYNDRTMFLEENPTITQRLKRSSLIAHETAHMWFGDLVTMKWFSDVWNKEVFANWYAAQIVRPHYPKLTTISILFALTSPMHTAKTGQGARSPYNRILTISAMPDWYIAILSTARVR